MVPAGADSYDLVFRSDAPLPAIAEVTFEGNQAVLITDLEHAINDVAYGTPYSAYTFNLMLENQVDLGLLSVGVLQPYHSDVRTAVDLARDIFTYDPI